MDVTLESIITASHRLNGVAKRTPVEYCGRLSDKYQADIYLKREDLQSIRSFKIRGAYNKIASLTKEQKKRGVVCASAGNHAQGVAFSCNTLKIKGTIFMPSITPKQKIDKVKKFGGNTVEIKLVGVTFDEASQKAQSFCKKTDAIYVHPFNDQLTIAGQATVAKEVYEDLEESVDIIVSSIGGGGLISGILSYIKAIDSNIQVYGAEPTGAAGMFESLQAKKVVSLKDIDTFVDGAAVQTVGNITFKICHQYIDNLFPVDEGHVCTTMIELYQNEGIIAEPAGALAVAALDQIKKKIKGKTVVCILSGGNNDIMRYPEIIERSLLYQGLKHYFLVNFAQKPGELKKFLEKVLGPNDDISRFEYIKKTNKEMGPALVGIELQDSKDYDALVKNMKKEKIQFQEVLSKDLLYQYII